MLSWKSDKLGDLERCFFALMDFTVYVKVNMKILLMEKKKREISPDQQTGIMKIRYYHLSDQSSDIQF